MNTTLRRQNPSALVGIRLRSGHALRQSAGCAKRLASVAGISTRLAEAWIAGDERSPVARAAEIVASVENPWPIITHQKTEAMAAAMNMSEDELRRRARVLMREETRAQGELDVLQMEFDPDDAEQLGQIERLAAAHASRLEEIAATARLLRRNLEDRKRNA